MSGSSPESGTLSASSVRQRLATACVGVAGCGGLGSNAAVMLARAGVGRLILADDDRVEACNLDRQCFFVRHLDALKVDALADVIHDTGCAAHVSCHARRLDAANLFSVFAEADVILEAFDTVESKATLIRAFADERFSEKWLVCASGLAGYGSPNGIRTERLSRSIYVCGDQQTDAAEEGVLGPRVILVAAQQALTAVRLLLGHVEV